MHARQSSDVMASRLAGQLCCCLTVYHCIHRTKYGHIFDSSSQVCYVLYCVHIGAIVPMAHARQSFDLFGPRLAGVSPRVVDLSLACDGIRRIFDEVRHAKRLRLIYNVALWVPIVI